MTVKTPYHFVPLSQWVLLPDWAHKVSHDIPFEDGLCGTINYTLTNQSPLLVGNKHEKYQDDKGVEDGSTVVKWDKDPKGMPIIPGSSIKGMLRNVMEIATFSKMSNVEDKHFSYRDLSASDVDYTELLGKTIISAGWLKYSDNKWRLRSASHIELFDKEFNIYAGTNIENISQDNSDESIPIENRKILHEQSALEKYKQYPLLKPPISFKIRTREIEGTKGNIVEIPRAIEFSDLESGINCNYGYPIFLGVRPGCTKYQADRLSFNYIFFKEHAIEKVIDPKLVKSFFESHDPDTIKYLKKNPHPQLGIPVFVRTDKIRKTITYISLSKLPRIQYEYTIKQLMEKQQVMQSSVASYDFSEMLLGTTRNFGLSLKSRVTLSDLKSKDFSKNRLNQTEKVILSTPKASYINAYIEQPEAVMSDFNNYNKITSKLSGWKKYPASLKSLHSRLSRQNIENNKVKTRLEVLNPNSVFEGKIHFHNLKKEELGALLWTMTLSNDTSKHHSLGHGKPLGLGIVQIDIGGYDFQANNQESEKNINEYIQIFINYMESEHSTNTIKNSWKNSPQIKHLLGFSNLQANTHGQAIQNLRYMDLDEYTNTKKSNNKQVLSAWNNLSRSEIDSIDFNNVKKYNYNRAVRGRLSHLKDESEYDKGIVLSREKPKKEDATAGSLVEVKQVKKALSENSDRFSQNNKIRELINKALNSDPLWEIDTVKLLISIIKNQSICKFIPRGAKGKATKELLNKLKQKYKLIQSQ